MNNRNQPCPCGSGKKFKFCCINTPLVLDEPEFHSEIFAQELEKDIKYSKKKGKEHGLLKKIVRGD